MDKCTVIQFQYDNFPPLGALYLAYGLEKEGIGFETRIFPAYKYGYDLNKLYSFLADSGDILAIGCYSDFLPYLIVALKKLKKRFPEKVIILGGAGPTEVAEEIISAFHFINFIIKGCGVYLLPKLIKRIQSGNGKLDDIHGLVYRHNNALVSNYYKGFYLNIPDLPAYHRIENIRLYDYFAIFTSFGCPYSCTFCSFRLVSPRKLIYRDLDEVIKEIKFIASIKKHKKFYLHIYDEAFVVNKKRVIEFCNLLRLEMLNMSWDCYGRINDMDEELLEVMSKSGCRKIYYGIESGSNETLREIKKGFTIEEAVEVLLLSKKYIKTTIASFIFLFPFEKPLDFYYTKMAYLYLQAKGINVQLHPLNPVKNSEIYLKYKKDLFQSKEVPSSYWPTFDLMPKTCVKLIKTYPEIFYYYYCYNFEHLHKILNSADSLFTPKYTKNSKRKAKNEAVRGSVGMG
ncbi:MAG TPA: radical SAM protein [Candidatus Margulisiibacteriota bacterium]|nr:radical SAM protein [Candidatus Margulisiibacteriota bacterium]